MIIFLQFIVFAAPFGLRHWQLVLVWAGIAQVALTLAAAPDAVMASFGMGVGLRLITLALRRLTRQRLAARGLHDNAAVAGKKLVLIGLCAGFPVHLAVMAAST